MPNTGWKLAQAVLINVMICGISSEHWQLQVTLKNVIVIMAVILTWGLPCCLSSKESAWNIVVAGDSGLIPGWGRSPRGGRGKPLQYSCLENPMDRGARQAIVHGATESQTQLSDWAYIHTYRCMILDSVLRIERWLRQMLPLGPSQGPQGGWSW